jgi:hypothetical protein
MPEQRKASFLPTGMQPCRTAISWTRQFAFANQWLAVVDREHAKKNCHWYEMLQFKSNIPSPATNEGGRNFNEICHEAEVVFLGE